MISIFAMIKIVTFMNKLQREKISFDATCVDKGKNILKSLVCYSKCHHFLFIKERIFLTVTIFAMIEFLSIMTKLQRGYILVDATHVHKEKTFFNCCICHTKFQQFLFIKKRII